jgi:hypothetical protein
VILALRLYVTCTSKQKRRGRVFRISMRAFPFIVADVRTRSSLLKTEMQLARTARVAATHYQSRKLDSIE